MKKAKTVKFSASALETLAIVAYRQPVIRPQIDEIRGVDSGWVLRSLMEKGLIRMMGRKDLPGRPIIYGTTKAFLELFNLNSLEDLPSLREIQPPPPIDEIQTTLDQVEAEGRGEAEVRVEGEGKVKAKAEGEQEAEVKVEGTSQTEHETEARIEMEPHDEIVAGGEATGDERLES